MLTLLLNRSYCQQGDEESMGLRKSPVSYHLSFDDDKFFKEDIIEQSGKKSLEERKIDFPKARFGKGIRMREIPQTPDANNMTGIDLDLVTAVIFNTHPGNQMGFNQPFIWGSGRINARLGSVAFWARGDLAFAGPLFEQTSIGFGRKERALLGILVDEQNILSAYVRDARYQSHVLTSETTWNPMQWNHVVLNWDWAKGLQLWINGKEVASSWGRDAWFETALPGLFHLPAAGLTFDELYLFDRPISEKEITTLMKSNRAPDNEAIIYTRGSRPDAQNVAEISGASYHSSLPTIEPDDHLQITEVWPEAVSDQHVPGWYMVDGRNEIAWPHPYSMFTIIPGDADFHAEKVDLVTNPASLVNYVVLSGNLKGVNLQAATDRLPEMQHMFSVPDNRQFYYGAMINTQEGATFRIPFTEEYGTPEGFSGDIHVPLSGQKRIQNVGLYHCENLDFTTDSVLGKKMILNPALERLDQRYAFALHALTSRDERALASTTGKASDQIVETIDVGAFSRLNIFSDPFMEPCGLKSITLSLAVKTENSQEPIFIRVRDPAVPSRFWNQLVVNLVGFDRGFGTFRLGIDFQDLILTGGDRIWIDIGAAGRTEVLFGHAEYPSSIYIEESGLYTAIDAYSEKEIVSAQAQYSKMYEFMPWQFTNRNPSIDEPYCYGGPFDMLLPAMAILRTNPDHFVANYLTRMSGPDFKDGKPRDPAKTELVILSNPLEAPDWALYMRDFNRKRHKIADWWSMRQNQDGQLGGGWNDDVLFLSSHQPDLPLDGNENARFLIDATHHGLEKTNYFKDGFCNISPMDRMHIGDFISERYNSVVNNLGQAYAFERELQAAWRLDDPKRTPINYFADGFKSSVNVFNWYWGNDLPEKPYISKSLAELSKEFQLYTSVLDDYAMYRFTESNVHRDDYSPFGANNMYTYMLGGKRGTRLDAHLKLAVFWPSGGGVDLSRVVLYADDDSLKVAAYSFQREMRELVMRLCRITDGLYRIRICADHQGVGKEGTTLWEVSRELRRFDPVKLPIPPQIPVVILVEQLEAREQPDRLADLAIDVWDAEFENSTIRCEIHNLGNGPARNITIRLFDGETFLQDQVVETIEAPVDFIAKKKRLEFKNVTYTGNLHITIDPENKIREILEDNNRTGVYKRGTFQKGLAPKK